MKKIIACLALMFPVAAAAQIDAFNGFCNRGGQSVTVAGLSSTGKFQNVIPHCSVTVYLTGTTTKATIFADAASTPLANPFTADALTSLTPGKWLFYAANGQGYDVIGSGGDAPNTYPSPVVLGTDLIVKAGGGGPGLTFFSAGNNPPLFNTNVANPGTTPNLTFNPIQQSGNTVFGNFTGASAQPFFAAYACTGLLGCTYNAGTNTWTLNVPSTSTLSITTTDCIKVNGGNGPVSSGTANISQSGCESSPAIRMNPLEDATHVFIPFQQCVFSTDNSSLTAPGSSCDALSGEVTFFPGGLFNHNVAANMVWSNPALPSWLPAGNVTGVSIISNTSGYGAGPTSSCGGSGISCSGWVTQNPVTQNVVAVGGATGANLSTITATAADSFSVYCGCSGLVGNMTVTQVGLLVEFSGVTNPNPSSDLNVGYGLAYDHNTNTLSTDQGYPFQIAPMLTANLPLYSGSGAVAWVSDNTQTTSGGVCTGSGVAGSDYALCRSTIGGYTLLADLGTTGFGVTQVTNSDSSLTFSPNTGHVIGSLNTAHANTWSVTQQFNAGLNLGGAHSPLNTNGDDGASGKCLLGGGTGNTPHWGDCPGGGTVGPGTLGFLALFTPDGTHVGNSHIDEVTTAGHVTITEPVDVNSTGPSQFGFTYNGTPLVPGSATTAVYGVDSSGNAVVSEAGGAAARVCDATNGVCAGSGSLNVNGTPVSSPNLQDSATVTFGVSGSNIQATASGSGYTNVTGSVSQTTVAALNTLCGTGTLYATTPLSIATGGTLTCPTQFSKSGLWTIASGQTVTFSLPVTETDSPSQHFTGSGLVVLPSQDARPEWWGAVNDWNGTAGTDNAAAFNAAATALASGNILMKLGLCYKVGSTVTISKSNLGIAGVSTGQPVQASLTPTSACLINSSASATTLSVGGASTGAHIYSNSIKNIYFGRSANPTGTATGVSITHEQQAILSAVRSDDSFNNFYFSDTGAVTVLTSSANWGYEGLTLAAGTYCGFCMDDAAGASNASITINGSNASTNNNSTITTRAWSLTGGTISDVNILQPTAFLTTTGMYIRNTGSGGFHADDIHITDPVYDSQFGIAIDVANVNVNQSGAVDFKGGWVNSNTDTTLVSIDSAYGISIKGMQIYPNKTGGTTQAVLIHSGNLNVFSNNNISMGQGLGWSTGNCIKLDGASDNVVTGNSCQMNNSSGTAIALVNTSTYNTVQGNSLTGTASVGISTDATSSNNKYINFNTINPGGITTPLSDSGSNNQLTGGGTTTNPLTTAISGGAAPGTTFDGSTARTFDYHSFGALAAANGVFTGTPDASGATQFKLPVASSFVPAANGEAGYDSAGKNWHVWDNAVDAVLALFPAASPPTGGNCAQWVVTGGVYTLTSAGGPCGTSSGTVTTTGSPASGDIAAFSGASSITTATATQVNTLIKTLTGCNTVGNVYSPQSGTCVAAGTSTNESHTASSSASLAFTTCITGSNTNYEIRVQNLLPATASTDIVIDFSTNGGSSYDNTSGHYSYVAPGWIVGATATFGSASTTTIALSDGAAALLNSGAGLTAKAFLTNPGGSTGTTVLSQAWEQQSGIGSKVVQTSGFYNQSAVNAFRIRATSGNLTSGTVTCVPLAN